jgi:esterase/lipase
MRNRRPSDNNGRKEEGDEEKGEKSELAYSNASKSITDLWRQYSPSAWTEMYSEFLKYTTRMSEIYHEYAKSSEIMTALYKELATNAEKMTELYKESAKSTEVMTKSWLHFFGIKSLSKSNEEHEEKK